MGIMEGGCVYGRREQWYFKNQKWGSLDFSLSFVLFLNTWRFENKKRFKSLYL
jgi:hypothetical protein